LKVINVLLLICSVFPASFAVNAASPNIKELDAKRHALQQADNKNRTLASEFQQAELEYEAAKRETLDLDETYLENKASYSELVKLDDTKPGSISDEKLSAAKKKRNHSYVLLTESEAKQKKIKNKVTHAKGTTERALQKLKSAQNDYDRIAKQVAEQLLDLKLKTFKRKQTVVAEASYRCSDNESRAMCRAKATSQAVNNAVAKGSVVTVSSVTKMKNFQMTEDSVTSEVSASMINKEVLFDGWKADHTTYSVKIKAIIQPNISKSIAAQLKENIEREVRGGRAASLL